MFVARGGFAGVSYGMYTSAGRPLNGWAIYFQAHRVRSKSIMIQTHKYADPDAGADAIAGTKSGANPTAGANPNTRANPNTGANPRTKEPTS